MTAPIRQSDRAFGLTMAGALSVIFAVAWLVFGNVVTWLLVLAGIFAALALTVPGVLLPFNRLWGAFGQRLGRVTNVLILGTFLYTVVWPIGMLVRLFGSDPMRRRIQRDGGSYWLPVERQANPETLRDMF